MHVDTNISMHINTHRIEIFIFPPIVCDSFVNCNEYNMMVALNVTLFKKIKRKKKNPMNDGIVRINLFAELEFSIAFFLFGLDNFNSSMKFKRLIL